MGKLLRLAGHPDAKRLDQSNLGVRGKGSWFSAFAVLCEQLPQLWEPWVTGGLRDIGNKTETAGYS